MFAFYARSAQEMVVRLGLAMREGWLMRAKRLSVAALGLLLCLAGAAAGQTKEDREAKANAKARMQAAQTVYRGAVARWKLGPGPGESSSGDFAEKLYRWSRRWMEAQTEASDRKADQSTAAEDHLARMRDLEKIAREQLKRKLIAAVDVAAVEFYRLQAEKRVSKLKKK
jgi:hypothetical protein